MVDKYISIQRAAKLSGKSIQTIRRAVKAKKLRFKKKKTPQGFNYSISQDSLCELYNLQLETKNVETKQAPEAKVEEKQEVKAEVKEEPKNTMTIDAADFRSFAQTMERLVSQHAEERQSFLRLVNTMQEKIFVMENQINLLKTPERRWYQVWK